MFHEKYLLSRHVKVLNDEQGIRYFQLRQQVSVCEGTNLMNLTITRIHGTNFLVKLQQTVLGKSQKNRL